MSRGHFFKILSQHRNSDLWAEYAWLWDTDISTLYETYVETAESVPGTFVFLAENSGRSLEPMLAQMGQYLESLCSAGIKDNQHYAQAIEPLLNQAVVFIDVILLHHPSIESDSLPLQLAKVRFKLTKGVLVWCDRFERFRHKNYRGTQFETRCEQGHN